MYILSTTSNKPFAEEVARHLGEEIIECNCGRFHNGEVRIQNIDRSVRDQDVYVIYSAGNNIDGELMETKLLIRSCKQASAKSITLIVPFLPYARQDKKLNAREPISVKMVIEEFENAGATKIMTVDIHNSTIQGMSNCPFDNLTCIPLFAEYIKEHMLDHHVLSGGDKNDFVIISPDAGGTECAKNLANCLGLEMATMYKSRSAPGEVSSIKLLGEVEGKIAIIVDDMADTCGTLKKATEELATCIGDNAVIYAFISHGPFSHKIDADDPTNTQGKKNTSLVNIDESKLTSLFVTDSVNLYNKISQCEKINRISIASLVASAILRYHEKKSISEMLKMSSREIDNELDKFRMSPKCSLEEQVHKQTRMNNTLLAQVSMLDAQVSKLTKEKNANDNNRPRSSIMTNNDANGSSIAQSGLDVFDFTATC